MNLPRNTATQLASGALGFRAEFIENNGSFEK
jgi:hypothetical protein